MIDKKEEHKNRSMCTGGRERVRKREREGKRERERNGYVSKLYIFTEISQYSRIFYLW